MKLPGFMFYPGDWLKEPCLRRCSKSAKGALMDILCLMFECEDRGVLSSGGSAWSDEEISAAIGGDHRENLACLSELLTKGVVDRNSSGAIFSRRMVRDEQARRGNKERQARFRNARDNGEVTARSQPFTESENEDEKIGKIREFAKESGIPQSDADWFYWKGEGNGWTNGGKPIKNWKATIRSWQKAGYLPSQKPQQSNSKKPQESKAGLLPERKIWDTIKQMEEEAKQ